MSASSSLVNPSNSPGSKIDAPSAEEKVISVSSSRSRSAENFATVVNYCDGFYLCTVLRWITSTFLCIIVTLSFISFILSYMAFRLLWMEFRTKQQEGSYMLFKTGRGKILTWANKVSSDAFSLGSSPFG